MDGDGDWTTVDKSVLNGATIPDGIEKMIGFEGKGDPASGFYCVYDMGKVKVSYKCQFPHAKFSRMRRMPTEH